jgi:small-conductance mechanosensitive channel
VLTLTNVWGEVFQFDRISQIATVSLFMIGDKEISLVAIATFIGVLVLTAVVNRLVGRFLRQHIFTYFDWDEGIRHAVLAVVKYLILFSGIALGLEFIGIGLSALALFAGVIGIGIGFGLQNVASNFIAGLIILFERPIKKGDVVDAAGLEGRVEEIKARSTTLVTRDKVSVIVPNSEFIGKSVVNLSHGSPEIRLHVPVGVAYGTDVDLVVRVLKQVADSHADVLKNPAPSVRLTSFGDSALAFQLLVWTVNIDDKGKIVSDLNFGIHSAFKKHDIEIPFPQSDVHVRDLPRDAPKPIKS